jgi:hypothetical protein
MMCERQGKSPLKLDPSRFNLELKKYVDTYSIRLSNYITPNNVWRDELDFGIPLEGDGFFVRRACFVIQDLEINGETSGSQTRHDRVVGSNAMAITLGLEGLLKDEVAVSVKGNHHIPVA